MKKIFSMLALSAVAITAVSCSDDDKTAPAEQNQLLGKWSYMEELALDANGNVVSTYSDNNGECPYDTFEFKNNSVLQNIDYDFSDNANECSGNTTNGIWNVTGNTFKLALGEGEDFEDSFEIKKLTADAFEIQRPLSKEEAVDYELNVVALKFVFKKVK